MIKQEDRKVKILSDAEKILKQKLTIKNDEALLKEVSSLVEKPIFLANLEKIFLNYPKKF